MRRDVGRVFVQLFDISLGVWLGEPSSLCVFAETCGGALALEHNGDLFSCDHFVEPRHRLGNVAETPLAELVSSPQQRQFGLNKRDTLPRYCRECEVRFICNGGCPKDRILTTPDGEPGLNYLCEGFKAFFTHIDRPMKIMANLIMHRRPPCGDHGDACGGAGPSESAIFDRMMPPLARPTAVFAKGAEQVVVQQLLGCGPGIRAGSTVQVDSSRNP